MNNFESQKQIDKKQPDKKGSRTKKKREEMRKYREKCCLKQLSKSVTSPSKAFKSKSSYGKAILSQKLFFKKSIEEETRAYAFHAMHQFLFMQCESQHTFINVLQKVHNLMKFNSWNMQIKHSQR